MELPRTILFKAKRLDNREWVEGYLVPFCINTYKKGYELIDVDGINYDELDYFNPSYNSYEIDPTTLSQFTGWKDNHNHRIFENDIVEIVSSAKHSYKYLIWWCREMNMMVAIDLRHISFNGTDYYSNKAYRDYDTFCFMMQDPYGDAQDIKVIGNIFDNPEMIEEALNENN
jgi:uncharacterized phage protein (TIGR01671 family)